MIYLKKSLPAGISTYFSLKKLQNWVAVFLLVFFTGCKKEHTSMPVDGGPFPNRPNIIFILGDDIGFEIPSCNGGQSYSTPNIDMLAQQGMRFTQCHAMPLCSPSRFMLLTGKYNFRNYNKWGHMDIREKTIGNMFKDAGYKTAYFGKWQLDGGDKSIRTFGFDNYSVWDPWDESKDSRYKNPHVYENGEYLPFGQIENKYGDDIFTQRLSDFIDSNKTKPFFAFYSLCLSHTPFSPTPDDAAFAAWRPELEISDPAYFSSMINYMDKKIGQIIDKVKSAGLEDNTIIIFTGDNGTTWQITSQFNGETVHGGKGGTTEFGTHVPLIAYGPGIVPGVVNNDLIDYADMLPTLAGIAGIPVPTSFGALDGVSFFPQITGQQGTPKEWLFYYYDSNHGEKELRRWVQDKTYKLYDTGEFFDTENDVWEEHPIPYSMLTREQVIIRDKFLDVLSAMPNYVLQ